MRVLTARRLSRPISFGIAAMLFLFVVLSGLLIGASQWVPLVALLLFGGFACLLLLGARGVDDRHGWLLLGCWGVMLLSPVLRHLSGVPVGYVLEFVLFGLAVASARRLLLEASHDRALKLLLVLLAGHFLIALLSTLFGRSKLIASLWQFQYNLKWPLMFGLALFVVWGAGVEGAVRRIVLYSAAFLVPVVLLEVVAPGVYTKVFGISTDSNLNPILGSDLRQRGPFANAGNLAMVSALLSAGAIAQVVAGRSRKWLLLAAVYGAIVFFTGQRQELFALAVCALLFLVFVFRQHVHVLAVAMAIGLAGGVAACVYLEYVPLERTLIQWGVIDGIIPYSERAILTMKGIEVAQSYFPLGSGLGTYGGAGAQKFDLSLFVDLGFGRYWWFLRGKFLLDTYWPNIAAETGFFGALLLAIFFVVTWSVLCIRAWRAVGTPHYGFAFLGLAALTLLILNTPSSQTLTDPRGAIVFWLLVGAAWRVTAPAVTAQAGYASIGAPGRGPWSSTPA